jgi:4-oxalocrotonate tautomerase
MPIVEYRIPAQTYSAEAVADLLQRSCVLFSDELNAPIDRVRAVAHEISPSAMCVAGRLVSDGEPAAPFFTFFLLTGRPEEQRHRLLAGFTDLIVECLGVEKSLVRGSVILWPRRTGPLPVYRRR